MKRTQIFMNKLVYLDLSILEMNKIIMYEFCYEYIKPKYGEKAKICFMDTHSFIVYIKTEDIYASIAKDVEKRFDSSNDETSRKLPKKPSKIN